MKMPSIRSTSEVTRQGVSLQLAEAKHAAEIIYWAAKHFGDKLALTSSFQTQSVPLLHLVSRIAPNVTILFLDTGFHFPETRQFVRKLTNRLSLNVSTLYPLMGHESFREQHMGMWNTDANMCCYLNKVEPLQRELTKFRAWISGIRRDQTSARAETPALSEQANGLFKICPMINWKARDIAAYIDRYDLPRHPMHASGFRSIGCFPCTKPTSDNEDARSGRWSGTEKSECGLHYSTDSETSE